MPKLQDRVLQLMEQFVEGTLECRRRWPEWLQRPGQQECGVLWNVVRRIYAALTDGMTLPTTMPPRESRSVDGRLRDPRGTWRIVEVDESQHFNPFRTKTLRLYPQGTILAFPCQIWIQRGMVRKSLPGGGFAVPKPPLFPMDGGRHRQRAFRDALADLLPSLHGFHPTLRLADFELEPWIWSNDAGTRLRELVVARTTTPG